MGPFSSSCLWSVDSLGITNGWGKSFLLLLYHIGYIMIVHMANGGG
ncbi:hypothetical protein LR69_04323 [Geobacillus sp. BCO2]|nr:hypothetical protein LR69_04323 [Geobacillus sp. BCO2]